MKKIHDILDEMRSAENEILGRAEAVADEFCESFSYGQVEDYTITISSTGRMEDMSSTALSFTIYPNPVKGDVLNINNLEDDATYRIFNLMGQELGKGTIDDNAVLVGNLKTGVYLIEITSKDQTATKRFIKE